MSFTLSTVKSKCLALVLAISVIAIVASSLSAMQSEKESDPSHKYVVSDCLALHITSHFAVILVMVTLPNRIG